MNTKKMIITSAAVLALALNPLAGASAWDFSLSDLGNLFGGGSDQSPLKDEGTKPGTPNYQAPQDAFVFNLPEIQLPTFDFSMPSLTDTVNDLYDAGVDFFESITDPVMDTPVYQDVSSSPGNVASSEPDFIQSGWDYLTQTFIEPVSQMYSETKQDETPIRNPYAADDPFTAPAPADSIGPDVFDPAYGAGTNANPVQQSANPDPLTIIGAVTNPIMESITGVEAGSPQAKEWGEGVYQWTGGVFNVPMVTVFGKSLSDPYRTDSMSAGERGQYLVDHPLEVVEYAATVYGGVGLLNGGGTAAAGSAVTGAKEAYTGFRAAEGLSKASVAARTFGAPIQALTGTARTITIVGGALGTAGYEYETSTGNMHVVDGKLVDAEDKPVVVDAISAELLGMGATVHHTVLGDSSSDEFRTLVQADSLSPKLGQLSNEWGRNPDNSVDWLGQIASIAPQAVGGTLGFSQFPLSAFDAMATGYREDGIVGAGHGAAVTGWGVYSFFGDVLIASPVNIADSLLGGKGTVLASGEAGNLVANLPGLNYFKLASDEVKVDPATSEYPHLGFFLAMSPTVGIFGKDVVNSKGEGLQIQKGIPDTFMGKVNRVIDLGLYPVNIFTLPATKALEYTSNELSGSSEGNKLPPGMGGVGFNENVIKGIEVRAAEGKPLDLSTAEREAVLFGLDSKNPEVKQRAQDIADKVSPAEAQRLQSMAKEGVFSMDNGGTKVNSLLPGREMNAPEQFKEPVARILNTVTGLFSQDRMFDSVDVLLRVGDVSVTPSYDTEANKLTLVIDPFLNGGVSLNDQSRQEAVTLSMHSDLQQLFVSNLEKSSSKAEIVSLMRSLDREYWQEHKDAGYKDEELAFEVLSGSDSEQIRQTLQENEKFKSFMDDFTRQYIDLPHVKEYVIEPTLIHEVTHKDFHDVVGAQQRGMLEDQAVGRRYTELQSEFIAAHPELEEAATFDKDMELALSIDDPTQISRIESFEGMKETVKLLLEERSNILDTIRSEFGDGKAQNLAALMKLNGFDENLAMATRSSLSETQEDHNALSKFRYLQSGVDVLEDAYSVQTLKSDIAKYGYELVRDNWAQYIGSDKAGVKEEGYVDVDEVNEADIASLKTHRGKYEVKGAQSISEEQANAEIQDMLRDKKQGTQSQSIDEYYDVIEQGQLRTHPALIDKLDAELGIRHIHANLVKDTVRGTSILILGPEKVGKSTMTKLFAEKFDGNFVQAAEDDVNLVVTADKGLLAGPRSEHYLGSVARLDNVPTNVRDNIPRDAKPEFLPVTGIIYMELADTNGVQAVEKDKAQVITQDMADWQRMENIRLAVQHRDPLPAEMIDAMTRTDFIVADESKDGKRDYSGEADRIAEYFMQKR